MTFNTFRRGLHSAAMNNKARGWLYGAVMTALVVSHFGESSRSEKIALCLAGLFLACLPRLLQLASDAVQARQGGISLKQFRRREDKRKAGDAELQKERRKAFLKMFDAARPLVSESGMPMPSMWDATESEKEQWHAMVKHEMALRQVAAQNERFQNMLVDDDLALEQRQALFRQLNQHIEDWNDAVQEVVNPGKAHAAKLAEFDQRLHRARRDDDTRFAELDVTSTETSADRPCRVESLRPAVRVS